MHAPRSLGAYGLTMILGLAGGCGAIQKCAPPSVTTPPVAQTATSSPCTDLVNAERAKAGLGPAAEVGSINQAAQGQSVYQAEQQTMTHTGADGSNAGQRIEAAGFAWSTWAENVAAGQTDCASVIAAWMGSDGHRSNILSPAMTSIGIGSATGANGVIYWTLDLAAAR